MRIQFKRALTVLLCALAVYAASAKATRAQADAEKQKQQQQPAPFGSSLKRDKGGDKVKEGGTRTTDGGLPQPEEVVRVDTSLVVLDVSVTDAGGKRYVTGLTKDDFLIFEDDRPQAVASFTLGDDAASLPRSIILIFDRSQSQLAYLESSVEAAKRLVAQLAPADEMALVTDDVELSLGFTKDKKLLKKALDNFKKWTFEGYRTRSMQFSALLATLRELVPQKKRPIVILQTDGDEVERLSHLPELSGGQPQGPAGYDMSDVYAEVERSRVRIYTVIPNEKLTGLSEEEAMRRAGLIVERQRAARANLKDMWFGAERVPPPPRKQAANEPRGLPPEIERKLREARERMMRRGVEALVRGEEAAERVAELSGGWASYLETPEQAQDIYGRILADINRRYIIGYYPVNKNLDGTLRRVRVEVRGHPEYVVQGRKSYYAVQR